MKNSIKNAFKDYDKGIRPVGYKEPKRWYVLDKETGKFYPAKAIWAMVKNKRPADFHTNAACDALNENGYPPINLPAIISRQNYFNDELEKSKNDFPGARKKRLKDAPKKPEVIYSITKTYKRNQDVIDQVLEDAKGKCGLCGKQAPFKRSSNQTPYLEVHHKKKLADGGDDTVDNAIALCPNCHRQEHYG